MEDTVENVAMPNAEQIFEQEDPKDVSAKDKTAEPPIDGNPLTIGELKDSTLSNMVPTVPSVGPEVENAAPPNLQPELILPTAELVTAPAPTSTPTTETPPTDDSSPELTA